MSLLDKADVRRLLENPELRQEIANAVVEDPEVMVALADDIAEDLSDELEGDHAMVQQIVDTAIANPQFKERIVRKLVEELSD